MASKTFTLEECQQHSTEKDCWLAINGKVYDVTEFLDEHPGGYDIVVAATGKDATEDFEEIGHSSTAVEMLDKYLIGNFAGGVGTKKVKKAPVAATATSSSGSALFKALLPLIFIVLAIALFLQQQKKA